ncbi:MAG: cadherin-like beta sandwich domain-containing protein, partial [Fibrobacterota bacterium]
MMRILLSGVLFFIILISCTEYEYTNPADPESSEFIPDNEPPLFLTEPGDILDSVTFNHEYIDSVMAEDPEEEDISYNLVKKPSGMENYGGKVRWTPGGSDTGTHKIILEADDGDKKDSIEWEITVFNISPVILTDKSVADTVTINSQYRDTLSAYDTNATELSWSLNDGPSEALMSDSVLFWIPGASDTGSHAFSIAVEDGYGGIDSVSFDIIVINRTIPKITDIKLDHGNLQYEPAFNPGVFSYNLEVQNTRTSVIVTPYSNVSNHDIMINSQIIPAGNNTNPIALNTGVNKIYIRFISPDGDTLDTYDMNIMRREPVSSDNADLLSMNIASDIILTPSFDPDSLNYAASVPNSRESISVHFTPENSGASIQADLDGAALQISNGSTSAFVIQEGQNTITISVTSEDGTVNKDYEIIVSRALPPSDDDAGLFALNISAGALEPQFNPETTDYVDSVSYSVESVDIRPVLNDNEASLTINGSPNEGDGNDSYIMNLNTGSNEVTIIVTALDEVTKRTYTIDVIRLQNTESTLSALSVLDGLQLSPSFSPSVTEYTVALEENTDSLRIQASPKSDLASLKIDGNPAIEGETYTVRNLTDGQEVKIKATAQDTSVSTTYTITVNYLAADEARLASCDISGVIDSVEGNDTSALSFNPDTTEYNIVVPYSEDSLVFTLSPMDVDNASIEYGSNTYNGTSEIHAGPLLVGSNEVVFTVTAADNQTTVSYVFNIKRQAASNNAYLLSLDAVNPETGTNLAVSPVFSPESLSYTVELTEEIDSVEVFPTSENENSTIIINGNDTAVSGEKTAVQITSGTSSTIQIEVISESANNVNLYELTVMPPPSSNATLSDLLLEGYTINFSSSATAYNIDLLSDSSQVTLTPTVSDPSASLSVDGSIAQSGSPVSVSIPLSTGEPYDIFIEVETEDGTVNSYKITVIPPSDNSYLNSLVIEGYTINFDSAALNYAIDLLPGSTSVTITAEPSHGAATMTIDGQDAQSGTPTEVNLDISSAVSIPIVVTAEDGSTEKTYTVNVSPLSANAYLHSLPIQGHTISFDSSDMSYTIDLGANETSVIISPELSDTNASMTVGGTAAENNTPVDLSVSSTSVTNVDIVITAENQITQNTYTLTFNPPSDNDTLSSLSISGYTINPAFEPHLFEYSIDRNSYSENSLSLTAQTSDSEASFTVNGGAGTSGQAMNV